MFFSITCQRKIIEHFEFIWILKSSVVYTISAIFECMTATALPQIFSTNQNNFLYGSTCKYSWHICLLSLAETDL